MAQRRVLGIILAGFAMVLIVVAVLPRGWWRATEGDGRIDVGLRSVEVCDRDWDDDLGRSRTSCRDSTLEAIYQDADDDAGYGGRRRGPDLGAFTTVGSLLFGGGLVSAALLGLGAVLAFNSRDRRLPRALTTTITLAAAGFGALTIFFLLLCPDSFSVIPYGASPILALTGAVIGVVGGRCLAIFEPSFEPKRPVVPGSPTLALAVLGVSAMLAIGATTVAPWWSQKDGERVTLGPRWVEECDDDGCRRASIGGLAAHDFGEGGHKFFVQMGGMIFHLSLLILVLALLAIALTVAGQPVAGGLSPARWLLVLGAVYLTCSLLFWGSRPAYLGELGMSWGPVAAVLGGLGLLVGGFLLGRWVPPAPDPLGYVPMLEPAVGTVPTAAVPACPTCSAPMAWADTHRRFFCATCRVYV